MRQKPLPFRQVHLDYHNHESLPGLGSDFDAEEFVRTLEKAHVNSITCFARCHHGMFYYESKAHPERIHPHLAERNLLRKQLEACRSREIRAPIYTSVQWDHYTAERHPEWLCVGPDGKPVTMVESGPHEPGFYRYLCLNSPYRDWLKEHTQELLTTFPNLDGLFFDIVWSVDCSCRFCRVAMADAGRDFDHREDRLAYSDTMIEGFMQEMTYLVRRHNADCTVYYNNGNIGPGRREPLSAMTHLEFDALPSDSKEGYMNFPRKARFERTLGKDWVAMTGKFHRGWGDLHSYKNQAALEYDCFQLLALGGKCLIGDQLDPSGRLDSYGYDLIGKVYAQVEEREPWCADATAVVDIGVLSPQGGSRADIGVTRILQEGGHQFNFLDSESDFSPYKVIILPDRVTLSVTLAQKLAAYIAGDGRLLASFESGLNPEKTAFALPEFGVALRPDPTLDTEGEVVRGRIIGWKQAHYADFILPQGTVGEGLPQTEHVMYTRAAEVDILPGAQMLAPVILPHFFRTAAAFSSHMHAPSSGIIGSAGIVQKDRVIYFAHAIFEQYDHFASRWCKMLVLNALKMLLPDPCLR
ncbi:MAG: alpha-amylase family protein, partial [Armatimonadota bacterium]